MSWVGLLMLGFALGGAPPGNPWVVYRLGQGSHRQVFWKIQLRGEERDAQGRPARWVQMAWGTHPALKAPLLRASLLVRSQSGGLGPVSRALVSVGMALPRELPPHMLERTPGFRASTARAWLRPDVVQRRGKHSPLMTRGGTVAATPIEVMQGGKVVTRLWLCDDIPVLGLVRLEVPGGVSMEAVAWGQESSPAELEPLPSPAEAAPLRVGPGDGPGFVLPRLETPTKPLRHPERGQAMVEYSILTWILLLALVVLLTAPIPQIGGLNPGSAGPSKNLITLFLDAYQSYYNSFYFVLNLPFP